MRRALCIIVVALASATSARMAGAQELPAPVLGEPYEDRDPDRHRRGWAEPDFVRLQYGGWIGAMNIAAGYAALDDVVNVSVGFGFTPQQLGGQEVLNVDVTLALRPFHIDLGARDWTLVPLELGGALMYVFGDQYHVAVPSRYPSGYYPPTALHWLAHVGVELAWQPRHGLFARQAIFYRATTLDTFAMSFLENRDRLDVLDVVSSAVGYRVDF